MKGTFFILCFFYFALSKLSGQCPDRESLWKKMAEFQNSRSLTVKAQLNNLLQYEDKFKNCSNAYDSTHSWLLMRIGVMYYALEEYAQAVQYTKKAVEITYLDKAPDKVKGIYLAKFFYNLSIYYDSLRMFPERNQAIDTCISFEMRSGSAYRYSFFLLLKSIKTLYYKGEYDICIDHASFGESIMHKYYQYADSMDYITFFISYKAMALFALEKYAEADKFLQSRESEFKKINNKYYLGVIYSLFGKLNETKGNYKAAIIGYLAAYKIDRLTVQKATSADVLREIGKIYGEKYSDVRTAFVYFSKALKYSKGNDLSKLYAEMANTYKAKKDYDSAYYFFKKAFNVIKPGIDESDILIHTDDYLRGNTAQHLLNLVLDKADTYLEQFNFSGQIDALQHASHIYKLADQILNKIKSTQEDQESKLFWRKYTRRLYEHAIEACFAAHNDNDALYFFEKSKAVLLLDQMNENHYLKEGDVLRLAQIKKRISYLERKYKESDLSLGSDNDTVRELFLDRQKLNKIEQSFKSINPLYYQIFVDTGFVSVKDIREKLLKHKQSLLELFNGDSSVYSLVITDSHTSFSRIQKRCYDSLVALYNNYVTGDMKTSSAYNGYLSTAYCLYKLICKNNDLSNDRIIISPDGKYFPFEALVTGSAGQKVNYFLQDHAVTYTYSARFLMSNFFADSAKKSGDFLGFAPVNYPRAYSLSPLSGSDKSLDNISRQVGGNTNLVLAEATKANFMNNFFQYKIIQLYTHASDSSERKEPVIYFSDSSLYLSEVMPGKKPLTQLVVLSACETALGKNYEGEGVFSFNRGFAALGIASTVANLWSVDNVSTYKLTELFYKYLAKELPLDVALQKAKLEFIQTSGKQNQLPCYWAAPILVGKTDPILLDKPFQWKYVLAGAGLAGLALLAWQKITKNKSLTRARGTIQTAA